MFPSMAERPNMRKRVSVKGIDGQRPGKELQNPPPAQGFVEKSPGFPTIIWCLDVSKNRGTPKSSIK